MKILYCIASWFSLYYKGDVAEILINYMRYISFEAIYKSSPVQACTNIFEAVDKPSFIEAAHISEAIHKPSQLTTYISKSNPHMIVQL